MIKDGNQRWEHTVNRDFLRLRLRERRVFGTVILAAILDGAAGPWLAGALYDATGSYSPAFWIAGGCSAFSALAIWLAAPRRVRAVAGRADRLSAGGSCGT
jgi:hypothetical protein